MDDIIYMDNNPKLNDDLKTKMMQEFKIKDLALMHYFLGMEVHQNSKEIFTFQPKYAKDMLKKFGIDM